MCSPTADTTAAHLRVPCLDDASALNFAAYLREYDVPVSRVDGRYVVVPPRRAAKVWAAELGLFACIQGYASD